MDLEKIIDDLLEELRPLKFSAPVTHVYNPLEYAAEAYLAYLNAFFRTAQGNHTSGYEPRALGYGTDRCALRGDRCGKRLAGHSCQGRSS